MSDELAFCQAELATIRKLFVTDAAPRCQYMCLTTTLATAHCASCSSFLCDNCLFLHDRPSCRHSTGHCSESLSTFFSNGGVCTLDRDMTTIANERLRLNAAVDQEDALSISRFKAIDHLYSNFDAICSREDELAARVLTLSADQSTVHPSKKRRMMCTHDRVATGHPFANTAAPDGRWYTTTCQDCSIKREVKIVSLPRPCSLCTHWFGGHTDTESLSFAIHTHAEMNHSSDTFVCSHMCGFMTASPPLYATHVRSCEFRHGTIHEGAVHTGAGKSNVNVRWALLPKPASILCECAHCGRDIPSKDGDNHVYAMYGDARDELIFVCRVCSDIAESLPPIPP